MAWANARMFDDLIALPSQALEARYASTASTVGQLALHIVGGQEWYCYCLAGRPWTELLVPATAEELRALKATVAELDAVLLEEAGKPDALMTFQDEDGQRSALRSTLLSQAVLHPIEHRAQLAVALELNGYSGLVLDSYDLWVFERYEREAGQS
jgi:uncharacterized damage-inducible protein DinB